MRTSPLVAIIVASLVIAALPASADVVKCQRRIAKEGARYLQLRTKALDKCEEALVRGTVGSCPDAKALTAFAKIGEKLAAGIGAGCGGADKTCSPADRTGEDSVAALGWPAACPTYNGTCSNPIAFCEDIATCLQCIDDVVVDEHAAVAYESLALPSADALQKCQRTIGKAMGKFLTARASILAKCEDARLAGGAGACPDLPTTAKIDKARVMMEGSICKACGGHDGLCDTVDDFAPATIGFPATCPDTGTCADLGSVDNLGMLVECVRCVADHATTCTDRLQVPSLEAYPSTCPGPPSANSGCCSLAPFCASMPPGQPGDCTIQGGVFIPGAVCYLDADQSGCPVPGVCGTCGPP